jgi:hypothetical protein
MKSWMWVSSVIPLALLLLCLVGRPSPVADAAGSITNTSVVLGTTAAVAVTTATIGFKPQAAIPSGGAI